MAKTEAKNEPVDLDAVAAAAAAAPTPPANNGDPGVNPVELAAEQATAMFADMKAKAEAAIDNLTKQGLLELTRLRDEIDSLMVGLRQRHDKLIGESNANHEALVENVATHRHNVMATLEAKDVVADGVASLRKLFAPAPAVITHEDGKAGK